MLMGNQYIACDQRGREAYLGEEVLLLLQLLLCEGLSLVDLGLLLLLVLG